MSLSRRMMTFLAGMLAPFRDSRTPDGQRELNRRMRIVDEIKSKSKHYRAYISAPAACRCDGDGIHFCKRHRCYVVKGKADR